MDALQKKLIDTTTLMTNMPTSKDAAYIAKDCKNQNRIGLHFCLTEGRPLTEIKSHILVDKSGNFTARFHNRRGNRLWLNADAKKEIAAEFQAQWSRFVYLLGKQNGAPLHLDSHHHVHTDLPVFEAICPLFKQDGIGSVRITRNLTEYPVCSPITFYKFLYNKNLIHNSLAASDYFGSAEDIFRDISKISQCNTVCEVMVHLKYKDGVLCDFTNPTNYVPLQEEVQKIREIANCF